MTVSEESHKDLAGSEIYPDVQSDNEFPNASENRARSETQWVSIPNDEEEDDAAENRADYGDNDNDNGDD